MQKFNFDIEICDQWHVLQGEEQKGPYTYEHMIYMLQTLQIFEFDYVWAPHLETWTPIANLSDFSLDRIQRLIEKNKDHDSILKRKHKRVDFKTEVICHDDSTMWDGHTMTLSEGGCSITMLNPKIVPGNKVTLYFGKKREQDFSFVINAEVVAKKVNSKKIKHNTAFVYSVRFLPTEQVRIDQIKKWVDLKK